MRISSLQSFATLLLSAFAVLMACGFSSASRAFPGDLDEAFGNGAGYVLSRLSPASGADVNGRIALAPDGFLHQLGLCLNTAGEARACVFKYADDGSLVAAFGDGGKKLLALHPDSRGDAPASLLFTPDGKLVLVGSCATATAVHGRRFCLVRLNSNGAIDSTFGDSGYVLLPATVTGKDDSAISASWQGDSAIVISGSCGSLTDNASLSCAAKVFANGDIDSAFGGAGRAAIRLGADANVEEGAVAIVTTDLRVLLLANCRRAGTTPRSSFCFAMFLPDGQPDFTFGAQGRLLVPSDPDDPMEAGFGAAVALGSQGIFSYGRCTSDQVRFCVLRIDMDGGVTGGSTFEAIPMPNGETTYFPNAIAIGKDGYLYIGGFKSVDSQIWLQRYSIFARQIDTSFGINGLARLVRGTFVHNDLLDGGVLFTNDRVVVGGDCAPNPAANTGRDLCVARFHTRQDYFDVDSDNESKPNTDAILYLRHLLGFHDTALTSGALGTYADRTSATNIATYLSTPNPSYPDCSASIVGAPGGPQAMLDGIVLLRAMMGLTGDAVTNGIAFPAGTARTSWVDIKAHLNGNCGMALN